MNSDQVPDRSYRKLGGPYAWYALVLLTLVQAFNFLDRQIVSILAEDIKADLAITDAQIGFLYGTAFAIFHIIFIIPVARVADSWERRKLLSLSLGLWSMITALSGLTRNFTQLAIARVGVGIGETSVGPTCHSLIADYFPREVRATAMSIFVSGVSIGAGTGVVIGGLVVDGWKEAYPGGVGPFGIKAWQAAFFVVGIPGVLMSLLVYGLREPIRGLSEGRVADPPREQPGRAFFQEFSWIIPPLSLVRLASIGSRPLAINLITLLCVCLFTGLAVTLSGDFAQWITWSVGVYIVFSWAQSLKFRDAPAFAVMFQTPSYVLTVGGFTLMALTRFSINFWIPTFFLRYHGVGIAELAVVFGTISIIAGALGDIVGGLWADRWRKTNFAGRLYVGVVATALPIPIIIVMLTTSNVELAYLLLAPIIFFGALFTGPGASTVQDLVLPRMRGMGAAVLVLSLNLVGLGLGPYLVGRISDAVGDLRVAMIFALLTSVLAAICLGFAARHLREDEESRFHRAEAAGEVSTASTP